MDIQGKDIIQNLKRCDGQIQIYLSFFFVDKPDRAARRMQRRPTTPIRGLDLTQSVLMQLYIVKAQMIRMMTEPLFSKAVWMLLINSFSTSVGENTVIVVVFS